MIRPAPLTGYSSTVQLKLITADREFELASIGPDSISLRTPISLEPCNGRVLMTVDGHERNWNVLLPEGADLSNRFVTIRRL
jgi:hypothetical protein